MGIGFERCEDKGGKNAPKFIPNSNYHKEEEAPKPTKAYYPSNPKLSFNPKREVKRESLKSREEAFVCMFYDRADYLDEFYFQCKRLERMHVGYAGNSYRDEFFDFPPRSYSRASPHTSSRAFPKFSYAYNHRSYGFGSRKNRFELRRFGYDPRSHRSDHFPRRSGFPAGGFHCRFEPRHLDSLFFLRRGSRSTRSNGDVQKIVKTFSGRIVRCWIHKIYLTNSSTESSTFSRPM
jgi:hypothetical protein